MEAWRCVRRGYGRCMAGRGRYSVFPHHPRSLGRDWTTPWEDLQRSCWNRHISSCMRWPGHYSRAPYPYFSSRHFSLHWRPRYLSESRTQFQYCSWRPDRLSHTSLTHLSSYVMGSEGDEPSSKRRRHQGMITRNWEYVCNYNKENVKIPGGKEVDSQCEDSENQFDFSVMSYNILSQDLLEENSHLYRHCRRPVLHWSFRFPNILKEIKHFDADVLCLQEVQEDHYGTEIRPSLESLGYHCEYKMRTGKKPDGCAICFKHSKFSLLSVNPVEFYRPGIPLLDRHNVGLVLLLQPKIPCGASPAICIANTHLLYNPRRGDIKLTQLAMLLAEIFSVAHQKDGSCYPIVMCGDFNSVPGSPLYSFIREGKLDYEGLATGKVSGQEQSSRGQRILSIPIWPPNLGISQNCVYEVQQVPKVEKTDSDLTKTQQEQTEALLTTEKLSSSLQHHFSLSSVYSHYFPDTGIPEVTTCHSRSARTVDYIFYSSEKEAVTEHQDGKEEPSRVYDLLFGNLTQIVKKPAPTRGPCSALLSHAGHRRWQRQSDARNPLPKMNQGSQPGRTSWPHLPPLHVGYTVLTECPPVVFITGSKILAPKSLHSTAHSASRGISSRSFDEESCRTISLAPALQTE